MEDTQFDFENQLEEENEQKLIVPANMTGVLHVLNKSNLFSMEIWNSFVGKLSCRKKIYF